MFPCQSVWGGASPSLFFLLHRGGDGSWPSLGLAHLAGFKCSVTRIVLRNALHSLAIFSSCHFHCLWNRLMLLNVATRFRHWHLSEEVNSVQHGLLFQCLDCSRSGRAVQRFYGPVWARGLAMLCQPGSLLWRAAGHASGLHPAHPWPHHPALPTWVPAADFCLSSAAQRLETKGGSLGSPRVKTEMST